MLTARGVWLLILVGLAAFWSVWFAFYGAFAAIFSLTVLLWFIGEWAWFIARTTAAAGRVRVERHLVQNDREQPNLWAKVEATIRVRLALSPGGLSLPFVAAADKLPFGMGVVGGDRRMVGRLAVGEPLDIVYRLYPLAPGLVKFEGVELRFADYCGFFYQRVFLRVPTEYLVLPTLADEEGGQRATKRLNSLPPPGIHRLRRPGGGSELLDLREYRPGDPPKMIAWKATARRDQLITKEFENDVPVRCVLFLDASNGMRLGEPGNTPLARAAGVGAAVAQAASANRDIVGLAVFDENHTQLMKPARTQAHQMQMLRHFAEAAARLPDLATADLPTLSKFAYSLAVEMYPDLLDKRVNSRPFGLFWRPLFDSRARFVLLLPVLWSAYVFIGGGFETVVRWTRNVVRPQSLNDLPWFVAFGLVFLLWPIPLTGLYWLVFGLSGFFPAWANELTRRKQLAALFASLDGDTPAAIERYIHDDEAFAARADRFLLAHRVQPTPQLHDAHGNYRFLGAGKVAVLADAIVRSVGTARDNELYVVLADLVELHGQLDRLLAAVRAARARHHQVLVLLPWPADVPSPHEPRPKRNRGARQTLNTLVEESLIDGYLTKFDAVRAALVKAGASVSRFDEDDPVRLILQRLEQIRGARIRK
ncbi:MAG: DUF58 domain-containing protein [Fimbriiglobus sp.]|jgi:uncharacterized protein (DUF58 family)|nr:DUF58 domain-containing protein [Fimbriiglobus sp.]